MNKIFLLLILIFISGIVQAQTRFRFATPDGFSISGVKVNAYTPFGIEVFLYSDSVNGDFLSYKGFNKLHVEGKNYKTLDTIFKTEIPIGANITFVLQPEYQWLDEAVVSTSRSEVKLKESPVSITIIKPYLSENRIATDISQTLDQVPGVNVADNQVNIRNGNGWSYGAGSRVAVLVDDLPMLSADAQTAQFGFMPLENLASVEVVKSAGSVLYGSSALNGIVNLRTADATSTAHGRISTFGMVYGPAAKDSLNWSQSPRIAAGLNGYYSKKIKNVGLTVSMNMLNNQGYRMNEYEKRLRLAGKVKVQSTKIVGLEYGMATALQDGKNGSFLLWHTYGQGYVPLDSAYNFSNAKKWSFDPFVTFARNGWSHKFLGRTLVLDNKIDNGDTQNQDNGSSLIYAEYRVAKNTFNNRLLFSGGLVSSAGETHSPLFSGSQTSKNKSVYLQTDLKLVRLKLSLGGRYEHFKLNSFQQSRPVFRAGANYTLARYTFLRGSWGQGYRFPSMAEAFISTTAGSVRVYPNPDLKPETGENIEFGLKQGYRLGKFRAYADVAAFSTTYRNLMEFTFAQWGSLTQPLLGFGFKSVNTKKARISGFEIETAGTGKWGKADISLLAGYTYTNPISLEPDSIFANDFSGNALSYAVTRAEQNTALKYRFRHLIRADVQVQYQKWECGLGFKYNSMMLNMDDAFVSVISPSIKTAWKTLGAAKVFDLRVAYLIRKDTKLNFQILNVFNSLYMYRPADLRPPRSYQLQLSYWF